MDFFKRPPQWKEYFTSYPNGFSLMEMLSDWASKANILKKDLDNTKEDINNKTDKTGNHEGTWQGFNPTEVEETIQAVVNNHEVAINETKSKLKGLEHNALHYGITGEDEVLDTQTFQDLVNGVEEGSEIYFPNGLYRFNQPITINKRITIRGSGAAWRGTTFHFNNCSGFIVGESHVEISRITIFCVNNNKNHLVNINNQVFGNVGIHLLYTNTQKSSGFKDYNLSISGFSIALLTNQQGELWSGAYREHHNIRVSHNEYGVVSIDGATYDKFIGGSILTNHKRGVHLDTINTNIFTNIHFIGTAIEGNGDTVTNQDIFEDYGVFVGKLGELRLTNCYIEKNVLYTDDSGKIYFSETYVNPNNKIFGKGSITMDRSLGVHSIKKKFETLSPSDFGTKPGFTYTSLSDETPHIRIQNNVKGTANILFKPFQISKVPIKYVKGVKFSFYYKINSGILSPDFGIGADVRMNGYLPLRRTTMHPKSLTPRLVLGEYQMCEVFTLYYPPFLTSNGVLPEHVTEDFLIQLIFSNKTASNEADYSRHNLDIEILNPVLTLYADVEV